MANPRLSPAALAKLLDHQVTDRNYITPAQLAEIERRLGRHGTWDWTDFREVCQEAFCEHPDRDMELEPDQQSWKDLTRAQASAVIDYLGQSGSGGRRSRGREEW